MPREKTYKTAGAFDRAVENYFNNISVMEAVMYPELVGYTNKGKPRYDTKQALKDDGMPLMRLRYLVPPRIEHMCTYLGISRQTLHNYGREDAYRKVVESARLRIEAYLSEEILTRDRVDGVKFCLSHNYGWGERQVVEHTVSEKKPLTSAEKADLYEQMRREMIEDADNGTGSET